MRSLTPGDILEQEVEAVPAAEETTATEDGAAATEEATATENGAAAGEEAPATGVEAPKSVEKKKVSFFFSSTGKLQYVCTATTMVSRCVRRIRQY